jgi:hypothetical protein
VLRIVILSLGLILATTATARGGGHSSSSHSGSHSSTHSSTKSIGYGSTNSSTESVHGYTTKNGTYVAPYHRTTADHTKNNNFSTKGNLNPYTGKKGTKPGDNE